MLYFYFAFQHTCPVNGFSVLYSAHTASYNLSEHI